MENMMVEKVTGKGSDPVDPRLTKFKSSKAALHQLTDSCRYHIRASRQSGRKELAQQQSKFRSRGFVYC